MPRAGRDRVAADPAPPQPAPPATLDELAQRLRGRRAAAASPSFAELTERIGTLRRERGAGSSVPGRVTVYDCFRDGRKRVDATLIMDIVRALGGDEAEVQQWRVWCAGLSHQTSTEAVVSFRRGVPVPDGVFIGRDAELEYARAHRRLLITGIGGAGKTQFALQTLAAHHRAGRISEVITVDVRGTDSERPARPLAVVESIERALEIVGTGTSLVARVRAISARLAQDRIGLFLDDARTEDQVRMLVQRIATVPVVVTSRAVLELPGSVRVLTLPPWGAADALTVLRAHVGSERVDAEPEAAGRIVELAGGLPLATTLVAARISQQPNWSMADHWEAMRRRSETAQFDTAVQSAIRGSYDALPPASRRALRLLATQPCQHLSDGQFAALVGAGQDAAADLIHQLEYFHCASRPEPGRIGLHVLVRSFAAAQSWEHDPQADRDEALIRLADELLDQAWSATEAVYTGALSRSRTPQRTVRPMTGPEGSDWLRSELGHLVDVARALTDRHPRFVDELTEAIGRFVHEQTSARFAEAFFRESVAAAERLDSAARAIAYQYLVHNLVSSGSPEAPATVRTLRSHAEAADMPLALVAATNAVGIIAGRSGDLQAALESFTEVVEMSQTTPGAQMAAVVGRDNRAIVLYRLGEHERSAQEHREAIRQAAGSDAVPVPVQALSYANLTDPLLALGDLDGAQAAAEEALALAEGRSRKVTLHATAALATVLLERGAVDEALSLLQGIESQEVYIVEASQRATMLLALGDAFAAAGQPEAAARWQRALDTAQAASFTYEQARALLRLGLAVRGTDRAEAQRLLEQAVTLFGDSRGTEPTRAVEELQRLHSGTTGPCTLENLIPPGV
ncbi:MAG TPA: hypothetical protein GXZ60_03545 [Intrasporangiaceae bacterium]|nr:hypothetical protein [Intrasporangiaceae bacterium]